MQLKELKLIVHNIFLQISSQKIVRNNFRDKILFVLLRSEVLICIKFQSSLKYNGNSIISEIQYPGGLQVPVFTNTREYLREILAFDLTGEGKFGQVRLKSALIIAKLKAARCNTSGSEIVFHWKRGTVTMSLDDGFSCQFYEVLWSGQLRRLFAN